MTCSTTCSSCTLAPIDRHEDPLDGADQLRLGAFTDGQHRAFTAAYDLLGDAAEQ
jgi:hypothetical protein